MKTSIIYTSIEAVDPAEIEGRVLILKTGTRDLNAAMATNELLKAFPNVTADQILIMPDDFKLMSLPQDELVSQLRGMLRRFDPSFK
jgi:hypothetical protein